MRLPPPGPLNMDNITAVIEFFSHALSLILVTVFTKTKYPKKFYNIINHL